MLALFRFRFVVAIAAGLLLAAALGAGGALSAGCPCSIWSSSATPAVSSENDPNAVEVGVKFRADTAGQISGVRFYKGSGNTGTHVGNLWTSSGASLARATFTGESTSGWQQVNFASPVNIAANTTYVASYYAPAGHYAADSNFFATALDVPPLHAPSGSNGVYRYGSGGGFPNQTYQSTNYWVDVVFVPAGATPTATPTAAATATSTPSGSSATPTGTSTPTNTPPAPTATATGGALQSGYTTTGTLKLAATYQSISVYAQFSGDSDANNSATVDWRPSGTTTWKHGMALAVDRRATVGGSSNPFYSQARGAVLMTQPNTSYDVRVTFADPDGVSGTNPVVATITTRDENPPSPGTARYVSASGSDSNAGTQSAPWRTLQKAADSVNAGDVVVVSAGTYAPVAISRSGTAASWVWFKNNPGDRPIISAAAGSGTLVDVTGSYVRFTGFELSGGQWGFFVRSPAHDVIIEQNYVHGHKADTSQNGVSVQIGETFSTQNSVANVTVQDNEIHADTLPEPETNEILTQATSGGHVIRRNKVIFYYQGSSGTHGTDCIGGLPNFNVWGGYYKDTDVDDNLCDGATDDGIEIDGGNANVRVWNNTVTHSNTGFSEAPVYYGPVYIFRNVVHDLKDHWVGSCVAVKDGEGGTGEVYFYHNTFELPSAANCQGTLKGFAKYASGNAQTNVVIKDNILHFWGRLYETGTKTADYNLNYVEPASADKVAEMNGTNYYSFSSFQSGTGQEAHGRWGTASYANAAGADYHLNAGSAGVDAGVVIPGFDDPDSPWPYTGNAPDIGAFER